VTEDILDLARGFQAELTAIRRDIHAHPELGLEEHRTADIVARKLEEWGIEVHRGVGVTGVVGVLRNGNEQASVGLRADMDALPMQEVTGLPHASTVPNRMHACGHDGHTAMLLGAAKLLSQTRNFNGTVNFIFQPAEEGLGGALAMIEDGLFQRFPCDAVFGMHNNPGMAVGEFSVCPGAAMAGCAFFDIVITGKGAHGAHPNQSIDPVLVGFHVVTALQSVVARNVSPNDTAVLSVTRIVSGDAYNVIPQTAKLAGTARAFKPEVMETLRANLTRIATNVAAGFGAEASVDFRVLFPPLVNNADELQIVADAAAAVVGEERIDRNKAPVMGSEDFAYMMNLVPGGHIRIGNGEASAAVHNQAYDFNDEAIPYGVAVYATIAERKLPRDTEFSR